MRRKLCKALTLGAASAGLMVASGPVIAQSFDSETATSAHGDVKGRGSARLHGAYDKCGSQNVVALIPAQSATGRKMQQIFGQASEVSLPLGEAPVDPGEEREVEDSVRTTNCTNYGQFAFNDVPAGDYFVTLIMARDYKPNKLGFQSNSAGTLVGGSKFSPGYDGAFMLQRVTVTPDKTSRVSLYHRSDT